RYADTLSGVRLILEDFGILERRRESGDRYFLAQALIFIDRLLRRPETPVVHDRDDYSADDQRLSWIGHADQDAWVRFIDAMSNSGMARLEPISASGSAKVRLAYNKPLGVLLDSEPKSEAKIFWDNYCG